MGTLFWNQITKYLSHGKKNPTFCSSWIFLDLVLSVANNLGAIIDPVPPDQHFPTHPESGTESTHHLSSQNRQRIGYVIQLFSLSCSEPHIIWHIAQQKFIISCLFATK